MRQLLSLTMGFAAGACIGAALVIAFSPVSAEEVVLNLKRGWAETLEEARNASETRRAELEAELARKRTQPTPRLPG